MCIINGIKTDFLSNGEDKKLFTHIVRLQPGLGMQPGERGRGRKKHLLILRRPKPQSHIQGPKAWAYGLQPELTR